MTDIDLTEAVEAAARAMYADHCRRMDYPAAAWDDKPALERHAWLGMAAPVVAACAPILRAQALEAAADAWTQGAWNDAPTMANRIANRIAYGQYAGDWLRASAAEIRGPRMSAIERAARGAQGVYVWVGFRDESGDDDGRYGTLDSADSRQVAQEVIASLRADLASGDPTRTWQATQALGLGMETQAEADCAECDMGDDTEHECPPIKYVRVHSYWMEVPDA